jgi:hypothetical protein
MAWLPISIRHSTRTSPYSHRLLGTWEGSGTGEYPTIDDFSYAESITFTHVGKPFVAYTQRTRNPDSGLPMHAESGYLRVPLPGSIEIVMAQPTGLAEIYEGAVVGGEGPAGDRRAVDLDRLDVDGEGGHRHRTDDLGDRRRPALHVPHGRRRTAAHPSPERHAPSGRLTRQLERAGMFTGAAQLQMAVDRFRPGHEQDI